MGTSASTIMNWIMINSDTLTATEQIERDIEMVQREQFKREQDAHREALRNAAEQKEIDEHNAYQLQLARNKMAYDALRAHKEHQLATQREYQYEICGIYHCPTIKYANDILKYYITEFYNFIASCNHHTHITILHHTLQSNHNNIFSRSKNTSFTSKDVRPNSYIYVIPQPDPSSRINTRNTYFIYDIVQRRKLPPIVLLHSIVEESNFNIQIRYRIMDDVTYGGNFYIYDHYDIVFNVIRTNHV